MNIRLAILSLFLVFALVVPAIAQGSPKSTQNTQSAASASSGGTPSSSASGSSALPNEKNLLIGAGSNNAGSTVKPVKSLGIWAFVQMILVLALVVAGIYALFYFLKRVGGPKRQENALIGVLSTKVLQPNRALHLIDVGGQLYLVGTSENSVNLVSSIENKEAIDQIRLRASQTKPVQDRRSFLEVFAGSFRKGASGSFGLGGSLMDSMGFIKQQRDRLKKM